MPTLQLLEPADFFVLRTPLLPFSAIDPGPMGPPPNLGTAVARARQQLGELLDRPEVREALWLASPSLWETVDVWRRQPDTKRGQKVERALVRYLYRMAARPTPFGLFAGLTLGRLGKTTELRLEGSQLYQRHTRLDMDYLTGLMRACEADAAVRHDCTYRPNSSIWMVGESLRYIERRQLGQRHTYHLSAVEASEPVRLVLECARGGATPRAMSRAICAADSDIEIDEAADFVDELIAIGLLVSDLEPPLTGRDAVRSFVSALHELPAGRERSAQLESVLGDLGALDAGGVGTDPARYRAIVSKLPPLDASNESTRSLQVDLYKPPANLTLGAEVIEELTRGVHLLHRLTPSVTAPALRRFIDAFEARYQGREVPLLEALDEEFGVGFAPDDNPAADGSQLLAGLAFPSPTGQGRPWERRDTHIYQLLEAARRQGLRAIELTEDDFVALEATERLPLPRAFAAVGALAARTSEDAAAGRFALHLAGGGGPSGATMLGRFCHLSVDLRAAVSQHLRVEESFEPDALFAEVVHLPEGVLGNVLQRPVLRGHEIAFLGRSGAESEAQVPVSDLRLRVVDGRVELRSASRDRRVVPRLTTAHVFDASGLGVYRLLGHLQRQGTAGGFQWSWGTLGELPGFFPRLTSGRLVLARARWRLDSEALQSVIQSSGVEDRWNAIQHLRAHHGLPRWVVLVDGDHRLLTDLDSPLSVESFAQLAREHHGAILEENFPAADELCVTGPEGRFVHEFVVPMTSHAALQPTLAPPPRATRCGQRRVLRHLPGSTWLYAKIYAGAATVDHLLTAAITPFVQRALRAGYADRWFFLRYADPDWHLRVRVRGAPRQLWGEAWPQLTSELAPFLDDGRIHRLALDTYEPERERYGGDEGLELAEQVFHFDSDAALEAIAASRGEAGAAHRWRLLLSGIDRLLGDFHFDLPSRSALMSRLRDAYGREHHADAALERQLSAKYRSQRALIEQTLDGALDVDGPAFAALRHRSERLAPVMLQLRDLSQNNRLCVSLEDLAASLVHLHANRVLRGAARAHELVLCDFLHRWYQSQLARSRDSSDPHHRLTLT